MKQQVIIKKNILEFVRQNKKYNNINLILLKNYKNIKIDKNDIFK